MYQSKGNILFVILNYLSLKRFESIYSTINSFSMKVSENKAREKGTNKVPTFPNPRVNIKRKMFNYSLKSWKFIVNV